MQHTFVSLTGGMTNNFSDTEGCHAGADSFAHSCWVGLSGICQLVAAAWGRSTSTLQGFLQYSEAHLSLLSLSANVCACSACLYPLSIDAASVSRAYTCSPSIGSFAVYMLCTAMLHNRFSLYRTVLSRGPALDTTDSAFV